MRRLARRRRRRLQPRAERSKAVGGRIGDLARLPGGDEMRKARPPRRYAPSRADLDLATASAGVAVLSPRSAPVCSSRRRCPSRSPGSPTISVHRVSFAVIQTTMRLRLSRGAPPHERLKVSSGARARRGSYGRLGRTRIARSTEAQRKAAARTARPQNARASPCRDRSLRSREPRVDDADEDPVHL